MGISVASLCLTSNSPHHRRLLTRLNIAFRHVIANVRRRHRPRRDTRRCIIHLTHRGTRTNITRATRSLPILNTSAVIVLGKRILRGPHSTRRTTRVLHGLSNRARRIVATITLTSDRRVLSYLIIASIAFEALASRSVTNCITDNRPLSGTNTCNVRKLNNYFIEGVGNDCRTMINLPLIRACRLLDGFGTLHRGESGRSN